MTRERMQADAPLQVELAITPMLDMTFQLLFFFILNYHPSALEMQMAMALPTEDKEAAAKSPEDVKKGNDQDDEDTLPADLTIFLKTQFDGFNNGSISQITVEKNHVAQPEIRSLDELRKYLESTRETLQNKEQINIKPDRRLNWSEFVKVRDICAKAGFKTGMGRPPDQGVTP
jgi:biopolymer transport protein ExbD